MMESLGAMLKHPNDIYPLLKLKMVVRKMEKQTTPPEPHWAFCYRMLRGISPIYAFFIQQLDGDLRNARMIQAYLPTSKYLSSMLFTVIFMIVIGIFHDLKYEENSVKVVHCLNDMVTNALTPVEDCLIYMSALKDPSIFRFFAIPQIMAIGTLALCYNNIEVFRGVVKMRRGLAAKVIHRTKAMPDVYGAFFDYSCMLKSKVDKSDPNAMEILSRLEAIQKACMDYGVLTKRRSSYIIRKEPNYNCAMVALRLIMLAIIFAYFFSAIRPSH